MKAGLLLTSVGCGLALAASGAAYGVTCSGTVCNFTTADSQSTQQTYLSNTSYSAYNWAAGSYSFASTGGLSLRCDAGEIYSGPVVTGNKTEPTTVITASYDDSHLLTVNGVTGESVPGAGCTVEYLELKNQNIEITQGASGILISHVWVNGIAFSQQTLGYWESVPTVYIDGSSGTDSASEGIAYSRIEWMNIGNNCTDAGGTPTDSDGYGVCGSIAFHGWNSNLEIANNFMSGGIGYEGIKGMSATSGVQYSTDLSIHNNDLSNTHRIGIEMQEDVCSGDTIYANSYHDDYNPDRNTMGISSVNCAPSNGASSPSFNNHDNTIVGNVAANPSCGSAYCILAYGEEQWGNEPIVNGLLLQGYWTHGLVMGANNSSTPSAAGTFENTIVQGPNMTSGGSSTTPFIGCEDGGTYPGSCNWITGTVTDSNNSTSSTVTVQTSAMPTITPSSGSYSYPLTVTLSNSAANQSSWCTTDGSTPNPGGGTAVQYDAVDGATLVLSSPATVKCVGMWGQGGNTATWPSGYGWQASAVASASYTAAGAGGPVTITSGTVVITGGDVQIN